MLKHLTFAVVAAVLAVTFRSSLSQSGSCTSCANENAEIDFFRRYTSVTKQKELLEMYPLNEAPRTNGSDTTEPSFEFTGQHMLVESNSDILNTLVCRMCNIHEITLHASLLFLSNNTGGPLIQLSRKMSQVFTLDVQSKGNVLNVLYLHQSKIVLQKFRLDLRIGTWYKIAVHFSGNLLKLFVDCELVESRLIPIPDYCVKLTDLSVSVGRNLQDEYYTGSLQSVRLIVSKNPLEKQCQSSVDKDEVDCPICGSHMTAMKQLKAEKERVSELEVKLANLALELEQNCLNMTTLDNNRQKKSCQIGSLLVLDGEFVMTWDNRTCYCQDGTSKCVDPNTLVVAPSATVTEVTVTQPSPSSLAAEVEKCGDRTVGTNKIQLAVNEIDYTKVDDECVINKCVSSMFGGAQYEAPEYVSCNAINTDCPTINGDRDRNLSICCTNCRACVFASCPENSECINVATSFKCRCKSGYIESGGICEDIDECSTNEHDCPINSTCMNTDGSFECRCPDYFEIQIVNGKKMCVDINECANSAANVCPSDTTCRNRPFGFDCDCNDGYELVDNRCIPVCNPPCEFGTCYAPGMCNCTEGYKGKECQKDIDECEDNPCTGENSECVNTFGGFFCTCKIGYQKVYTKNGNYFCRSIDECSTGLHSCPQGTTCMNTMKYYSCECNGGECRGKCTIEDGSLVHNGYTLIRGCDVCTCTDGDYKCERAPCNCSDNSEKTKECCPQCSRENYCFGVDGLMLQVGEHKTDSVDSCSVVSCGLIGNLPTLKIEDVSLSCQSLNCPRNKQYTPDGSCCPVCSLPSCTSSVNGHVVDISGETCTCDGNSWTCVSSGCNTTSLTGCPKEQIAKLGPGECPECLSQKYSENTCSS